MRNIRQVLFAAMLGIAAGNVLAADAGYVEPKITHVPFGEVKLVVPVTTVDPRMWQFKMGNIANSLDATEKWGGHAAVKVVLYGGGIQMLMSKDADVSSAVTALRARGVQFEVCNNSLRGQNVDFHTMNNVTDADIVPSGFLEVGWLQGQGYTVDPAN